MSVILETTYVQIDCPTCGFVFAVPESLINRRRKDGKSAWCPAGGHAMNWGETEADGLRKQIEAKDRRIASVEGSLTHTRDQLDATERQLRAQRGANTRLRRRVANGVCPCCRRTFADLARHMAGQHPDFATTEAAGE